MKPADRQKMCSNCDGRIPFDAHACPYCAAEQEVQEANSFQAPLFKNQSLQESLASLYTPPYASKGPAATAATEEKPAPKKKKETFKEVSQEKKSYSTPASFAGTSIPMSTTDEEETPGENPLWSILALSSGATLLTLGLLQLFFSENGFLRLEFTSSYWFIYTLLSLPLFYFGYKKANKLN